MPDASTITNQYGFGNDRNGTQQFQTQIIDANGIKKKQFTNSRGLTTATWEQLSQATNNQNPWLWTSYIYNPINELMSVMDDPGDEITYQYDWFGRRLEMDHPDGGITSFEYDLTGNVTSKVTANLEAINESIDYTYDFERLTNIAYPQNPQNDVSYTYGGPQAVDNRSGRIMLQTDATGEQRFAYNALGALVYNKRDVKVDAATTISMTTNWEYDTWNRLTKLTYPDGEELTYNYNLGGMLQSMSSILNGNTQHYVRQLGYDKFEQNVYVKYGNNTETTYTYDAQRRWLDKINASTSGGTEFMKNDYVYDNVGNISQITNSAPAQSNIGGSTSYSFSYDDMYRLTSANGTHLGAGGVVNEYQLTMGYNNAHAITSKNQTHTKGGNVVDATSYNFDYAYGGAQPHAPTLLTSADNNDDDRQYNYDANGNQLSFSASGCEFRAYSWDEENRLMLVTDDDEEHFYTYDANGDRIIKNTQTLVAPNNPPAPGSFAALQDYTVYMSPYIVVREGVVTKHIYTEGRRISSKLSGNYDVATGNINEAANAGSMLTYYFHPDHLGNSSYISDASGEVSQHIEYFPFGEVFIEEQNNTYNTPYLYNGKELDDKTGLYYYGARYYDPVLSNWLSVDPLADHPNQVNKSPYAYAWNNPIKYDDPDGRCPNCVTAGIGAAVGGVVGGASSVIGSWWRGEKVSLKEVGKAAFSGAVAGAVVGSGAGLVAAAGGLATAGGVAATAGVGVASGIAGETTSQTLDMVDGTRAVGDFDGEAIAINGAIAGPLNVAAAGAGQALKGPISKSTSKLLGTSKETVKAAQKAAGKQAKKTGATNAQFKDARKVAKQDAIATGVKRVNTAIQSGTQSVSGTINGSVRSAANTKQEK